MTLINWIEIIRPDNADIAIGLMEKELKNRQLAIAWRIYDGRTDLETDVTLKSIHRDMESIYLVLKRQNNSETTHRISLKGKSAVRVQPGKVTVQAEEHSSDIGLIYEFVLQVQSKS